jgi:hypothetical protein
LSIVSAIVAAHGGTVSARGAAGSGTTFMVHLPTSPPVVGTPSDQQAVDPRHVGATAGGDVTPVEVGGANEIARRADASTNAGRTPDGAS